MKENVFYEPLNKLKGSNNLYKYFIAAHTRTDVCGKKEYAASGI